MPVLRSPTKRAGEPGTLPVPGSGNAGDPYILEGYYIRRRVRVFNAHVVFRDCYIDGNYVVSDDDDLFA